MTVGGSILSAFRLRVLRRSKNSVAEHFGECDVRCLSLTDLSQKPTPYRNTFESSRSEENILESGNRRNSWKRRSMLPSIADSGISSSFSSSSGRSRPQSCLIDYTSGSFSIFGGKQTLSAIVDTDNGYDSLNMSTDSVSSLIRVDSIQEKSRDIMRRRHRFVKKRQRDSQVFSDEENDENTRTPLSMCKMDSSVENRRSVHFDDVEIETLVLQKSEMKPSASMVSLIRNNSVQLKSWQIRRHRRAMYNKQKRASRLLLAGENVKYEERLV